MTGRELADSQRETDAIDHHGRKVILAGFGRQGTDLGRLLISAGMRSVFIDHHAANVDVLRKFGFEIYYGDITRPAMMTLYCFYNRDKYFPEKDIPGGHPPRTSSFLFLSSVNNQPVKAYFIN